MKNEFTYKKGCQYIDWLCDSNKLVLLRDTKTVDEDKKKKYAKALKCKSGDVLCLVLGKNISSYAYHKIISEFGGYTVDSVIEGENALLSVSYWLKNRKAIISNHTLFIPWKELVEAIKEFDNPAYFAPKI